MLTNRHFISCAALLVAVSTLATSQTGMAAAGNQSSKEKESQLIAVLRSDAPAAEKAITCKRLAIYGTKDAVPALAPLLLDKDLSSWARIALEVIPGPEADEALRGAVGKAQGRLLVGVINSIAVRRDAQAVNGLVERLKDADPDVASAAAVALGHIGGDPAVKALGESLAEAPAVVRPAVAEGCILCAEKYLSEGRSAAAMRLYDVVRQANLPKQKLLEATRGAILARGTSGIPLLMEQLKSADKAQLGIGLRTARELPGREVTEALAAELDRMSPERQPLLLLAVADRKDEAVLPIVLKAAQSGPKELRTTALDVLLRLGNVSSVPALLAAAAQNDPDVAQTAKQTLTHLPGRDIDADLLARLPQATGRSRQVLIELAGERQIDGALPLLVRSTEDADAGMRSAAVQAVGVMGGTKEAAGLVTLLQKSTDVKDRANIEKALMAITGRARESGVSCLLPLMQNSDTALRTIGLHTLAVAGGLEALAAVKSALDDKAETVQDEAARVLSTWPNNWPDDTAAADVLLTLAKSGKKTLHQVLGLRGYLQHVRGNKALDDGRKVARISELLPAVQRPEEKRLVIGVVGSIRTAAALELLTTTLASDPAVAEDAYAAIVNMVDTDRNVRGLSRDQRLKALQTVAEQSKNDATKKKAQDRLKKMQG